MNVTPLEMKAVRKGSLYKIEPDYTFKSRLVVQTFRQQTEEYSVSTLATIAYIRTEREALVIVDEYGSSVVHMDLSLPPPRNQTKRLFSEQSQYTLLDKR